MHPITHASYSYLRSLFLVQSLRFTTFFKKSIGLHGAERSHSSAGLPLPGCHPPSNPTSLHALSSLSPPDICTLCSLPRGRYHCSFSCTTRPLLLSSGPSESHSPPPSQHLSLRILMNRKLSLGLHPSHAQHDPKSSFPWKKVEKPPGQDPLTHTCPVAAPAGRRYQSHAATPGAEEGQRLEHLSVLL